MKNNFVNKKSIVALLVLIAMVFALITVVSRFDCDVAKAAVDLSNGAKSAYLTDYSTGTVLYKLNENDRLPIASMVKVMTALLTFESVENGSLSFDDDVVVSERAAGMGGSQVFLDANTSHKVEQLLKSVIIASANDSCVALAEKISGSVEGFVNLMNERAVDLGMSNTHFANCTGLPAPENFSSAKDVVTMFGQLIKYPKYTQIARIWLEDYVHPDGRTTVMTNTNKLSRFYQGCDGGKTGFTSEAKFCLVATAKRADMRVLGAVIGVDGSKERFAAVSKMFDYAYANYSAKALAKRGEVLGQASVSNGKDRSVNFTVERDVIALAKRGENDEYELVYQLDKSKAPIALNEVVGKVYQVRNGIVIAEYDLISLDEIKRANLLDNIRRITDSW